MATETNNLKIKLIQPTDYFADESFNAVINDIDSKVLGIAHEKSVGHWSTWEKSKSYNVDDVVRVTNSKSNQYYSCVKAGISDVTEPTSNVTGDTVTDGTVSWIVCSIGGSSGTSSISNWLSNNFYTRGQLVFYNNKLYRNKINHTSLSTFALDSSEWQEITASNNIWMPSMYYDVGDTVIYDTMLYICRTANSDATFTPSNWALVNEYYTIPQYEDNTEYKIGQLVFHDNKILKANQAVKDTAFDSTHWDIVYDSYILPWSANYQYYQNNICIYNNKLYRCINSNKDATFTPSNWIRLSSGEIEDFKANHNYDENDVFKINNQLYSVKTKFTTTNADISNYIANVEPLIADISKWASNTYYYQGMIVEYQYNLYKCETAHKSSTLFVDEDKTTNTVYWKPLGKLNTQLEYYDSTKTYNINDCVLQKEDYGASKWMSGTAYKVDDIVVYNEIIYKCKTANSDTAFTESNWEEINTEKTVLYRCLKSTANAPSISSTEWEEIDCYIELASDKDIEDLFT